MKFCVTLCAALAALISVPQVTSAQEKSASAASPTYELSKLKGICDYVSDRTRAPVGSGVRFEYERMMNIAAGNTGSETAEVAKRNLQELWKSNQNSFRCNSSNFDVPGGNLLKYSISAESFGFMNSIVLKWQLESNFIDPADHRTIMDYMQDKLGRNAGTGMEVTLQEYFNLLRNQGGAKFCRELIDARNCGNVNMSQASRSVVEAYNRALQNAP